MIVFRNFMVLVVLIWLAIAHAQEAYADAGCEPRSAKHVAEHGGLAADSAWHVAHGDRPTCGDKASSSSSSGSSDSNRSHRASSSSNSSSDYSDDYNSDHEGRFCDGRWWC